MIPLFPWFPNSWAQVMVLESGGFPDRSLGLGYPQTKLIE